MEKNPFTLCLIRASHHPVLRDVYHYEVIEGPPSLIPLDEFYLYSQKLVEVSRSTLVVNIEVSLW